MEHTPLEIKNIIEYIPLVIIIVIILVTALTWDVMINKIHYFVTLIGVFLWAIYLYIGSNSNKIIEWRDDEYYIIPPSEENKNNTSFDNVKMVSKILVTLGIFSGGVILGFTSPTYQDNDTIDKAVTFKTVGAIILCISIIGIIFTILKLINYNLFNIFDIGGTNSAISTSTVNNLYFDDDNIKYVITPLSIIGLIIGIYLTVTGIKIDKNNIENNLNPIDDDSKISINKQKAVLSAGLIMQIVSVGLIIFFMYKYGVLNYESGDGNGYIGTVIIKVLLCLGLFLAGILCWAKSQQWPGIGKITTGKDTPESNTFAAHGGVYLILFCIAFVFCIGGLLKYTTYFRSGIALLSILIILFIVNLIDSSRDENLYNREHLSEEEKNIYKEKLYSETKREVEQSGSTGDIEQIIQAKIDEKILKIKKQEHPSNAITISFSIISIIIVIFMTLFRYVKHRLTDAVSLPKTFWYLFRNKDKDAELKDTERIFAYNKYLQQASIDNLTGKEWDTIIQMHNVTPTGTADTSLTSVPPVPLPSNNFNIWAVYFASMARWNPFLSVILIILWVSIIYTYVITSGKTDMWIASSFNGDMFSKIKDIIHSFFVTIIVALLLAAVILIPIIKEFNTSALDNILKFAESIQVWQWETKQPSSKNGGGSPSSSKHETVHDENVQSGGFAGSQTWIIALICSIGLWFTIVFWPSYAEYWSKGKKFDDVFLGYFIFATLFCWLSKSAFKSLADSSSTLHSYFVNDFILTRILRLFFTIIYLVPFSLWTILKFIIWGIMSALTLFKNEIFNIKRREEWEKIKLVFGTGELTSNNDLRFFGNLFGKIPTPESVSTTFIVEDKKGKLPTLEVPDPTVIQKAQESLNAQYRGSTNKFSDDEQIVITSSIDNYIANRDMGEKNYSDNDRIYINDDLPNIQQKLKVPTSLDKAQLKELLQIRIQLKKYTSGMSGESSQQANITPDNENAITIEQAKVSMISKLFKIIVLVVSFVLIILAIIYGFYQLKRKSTSSDSSSDGAGSSGGFGSMDSSTSTFSYIVILFVGIAGVIAFIRDKAIKSGIKNPENMIFDDYHPEDETSPVRQLTFAMTHIIYVILMVIVWIYDRDVDDNKKMSVVGMTVLGIFILFFHYILELIDIQHTPYDKENNTPTAGNAADKAGAGDGVVEEKAKSDKESSEESRSMFDILNSTLMRFITNIRVALNTLFFILICVFAHYKLHTLMVCLILLMFMFHLSKSKIGLTLLKLIWQLIIYIPCLILDTINSGRNTIGSTTRPIWIIVLVELILLAIMFGAPYLINKMGVSKSQIILAPVPLNAQHDTQLTTESKEIFIYHNTGMNRTAADDVDNCPAEEKKRYNYSFSGWFRLNGSVNSKNSDLTIFDFAGVPKITYNPFKANFKVTCKTIGMDNIADKIVYESHDNISQTDEYKEFAVANEIQISTQIPLQKWNYFVINYDGKSMDVFLNEELVGKSGFIMPDIKIEKITSGQKDGLNGNICNVVFSKEPMTIEQIKWTYNTIKTLEPPLIGTNTIADEVNNTGKKNIYTN